MKLCFFLILLFPCVYGHNPKPVIPSKPVSASVVMDSVTQLINLLNNLEQSSDNEMFKMHCKSIIAVINSKKTLSASEITYLSDLYTTLSDTTVPACAAILSSYLERRRPFIVSWVSPTDSAISIGWLLPPENWDPEKEYPLYVSLHGLYDPYTNIFQYMTWYMKPDSGIKKSMEDGYSFFPWGRGNRWYQGISETDIYEGISHLEGLVKVDSSRKYLVGHSMGGFGVWYLTQKSAETWAALGIYAGALSYYGTLNAQYAEKLKNIPVYIVVGDQDGLFNDNQTAFELLQEAGNSNVVFNTFHGGHESLLENWVNMYNWIRTFKREDVTGVKTDKTYNYYLYQNFPNPFNPTTKIKYAVGSKQYSKEVNEHVTLKIYDILGNELSTLVDEAKPAGQYEVEFSTKSGSASGGNALDLSSGIYFYELKAGWLKKPAKW